MALPKKKGKSSDEAFQCEVFVIRAEDEAFQIRMFLTGEDEINEYST